MKRVLMVAHVASMIKQFNMDNISILTSMGYSVDVACNFERGNAISDSAVMEFRKQLENMDICCFQIDFARSALEIQEHRRSIKQIEKILNSQNYSFIHTHGPVSSAIVRWVARRYRVPVIYTAHGFQFCKGGNLVDWLLYYPLEKALSKFTSLLRAC